MEPTLPGPKDGPPPALAEHLVEEIFIRVGDPVVLARASAACKAFCCLITDSTFLRRYRALHPPLLLGFIVPHDTTRPETPQFIPADAPHRNAPAGQALASGAADFRFFHLPHRRSPWYPCDARHGLVLLECRNDWRPFRLHELAVCDPLAPRNTLGLPPVPDSLLDSVPLHNSDETRDLPFDVFFDPSVSYNKMAQFRVMAWCPSRCAIFIYSSVSNAWTLGASVRADLLGPEDFYERDPPPTLASYVNGCLYRKLDGTDKLIKLDVSSMEFSVIHLPLCLEDILWYNDTIVVEDREGTMLICRLGVTSRNNLRLFITRIREDEEEEEDEHPVHTPIPLPHEYKQIHEDDEEEDDDHYSVHTPIPLPRECDSYDIDSVAQGYIFIKGYYHRYKKMKAFFTFDIKTMKLERVLSFKNVPSYLIPYFRSCQREEFETD